MSSPDNSVERVLQRLSSNSENKTLVQLFQELTLPDGSRVLTIDPVDTDHRLLGPVVIGHYKDTQAPSWLLLHGRVRSEGMLLSFFRASNVDQFLRHHLIDWVEHRFDVLFPDRNEDRDRMYRFTDCPHCDFQPGFDLYTREDWMKKGQPLVHKLRCFPMEMSFADLAERAHIQALSTVLARFQTLVTSPN